jgi:integrase
MTLVFYCTGLRPSEAPRLRLRDLDLHRRTFFIRDSKGRSRWVPFSKELARKLRGYLALRLGVEPRSPESPLFVRPDGRALRKGQVSWQYGHMFRRLGLKPLRGRVGPRCYDLRHAFAIRRLTRWCREGVDVRTRLPWLSAYMGHDGILGTEVYLTATPELLRFASRRFATRFRGGVRR